MASHTIEPDELERLKQHTVLSVDECARLMGTSRHSAYQACADNTLPGGCYRIGHRYVVPAAKFLRALGIK